MLRLSPFVLLLVATAAFADETAVETEQQADPQPATTPAPSGTVAVTATPAVATTTATPVATADARLTPGGKQEAEKTFPLGINATLSNSLGAGFLAPGLQAQPAWSSSLSLAPSARIPAIEGLPKMSLSGSINFSMGNWLPAFTNGGVYDRQLRVSDARVSFGLPSVFTEEFTGISISPGISASAPISIGSRQQNVVTSIGLRSPFSWNAPETPVGKFNVGYSPSVSFTVFHQVGATMPCDAIQQYGTPKPLGDPLVDADELPNFIAGRDAEVLEDGTCILRGRQRLGGLSNSLSLGWTSTDDAHSVGLSLGHSLSFLRPLTNQPELKSQFASDQNFNESLGGSLSYSYTVPVDFPLSLSVSAGSENSVFQTNKDGSQTVRFPFWDFYWPANNASGVSFDVSIGI